MKETGRYPSRTGETLIERTLRRGCSGAGRTQDGTLAQAYGDALAELSSWQTPSRAEAGEARWAERLAALVEYRSAGNDWPRHKAFVEGLEHDLGVWLHYQRAKLHRGELTKPRCGHWTRPCLVGGKAGS